VQVPHPGDDHHPPGLIRSVVLCVIALAAAPAASAATPHYAALPSPFTQLSPSPPLSGGATASAEGVRHRIAATTSVRVSVDRRGTPFAVQATQRLDVRVLGDYFFTIGAPALAVRAAPGSASEPGLRTTSFLWAGFDPGRRTLAARVTLDPAAASAALPLAIEVAGGHVTLRNTTSIDANEFAAEVELAPLERYARQLRSDITAGRSAPSGGVLATSKPRPAPFRATALLRVTGTIGGTRVDLLLGAAPATIPAGGPIRLTVVPVPPLALLRPQPGDSGRTLLRRVTQALLGIARANQYGAYLGNPDPVGTSKTTYAYRSAARPAPVAASRPAAPADHTLRTLLVAAALLAALALGVAAWARS
jgi:hypothetical protein